jgi:hypothetical protein
LTDVDEAEASPRAYGGWETGGDLSLISNRVGVGQHLVPAGDFAGDKGGTHHMTAGVTGHASRVSIVGGRWRRSAWERVEDAVRGIELLLSASAP